MTVENENNKRPVREPPHAVRSDGHLRPILAIDPSSTVTGYAVMTGDGKGDLIEAGLIRPTARFYPAVRMMEACDDIKQIIKDFKIGRGVIEIPSGKVQKRHGGGGAGLTTYGMAVGAMYYCMREELAGMVLCVHENTWTRGMPKARRAQTVRMMYPSFVASRDRGFDAADAIEIAWFFFRIERRVGPEMMSVGYDGLEIESDDHFAGG